MQLVNHRAAPQDAGRRAGGATALRRTRRNLLSSVSALAGSRHALARSAAVLAAAGWLAMTPPAAAQVIWNGNTSDNWFTGSNWQGGAVPEGGDVIVHIDGNPAVLDPALPGYDPDGAFVRMVRIGQDGDGQLTVRNGGTIVTDAGRWMVRKTSGFESWRVIPVSGDICGDGICISQGSLTLMIDWRG